MAADSWTHSDNVLRAGPLVNITLTLKQDVLKYWQKVGEAEGLTDNDQIASFLLQRYQQSLQGLRVSITCVHCHHRLKVIVQNILRSEYSCVHGENGLQLKSTPLHEAADQRQERNGTADVFSRGKSAEGGHLPYSAIGKQCVARHDSEQVTEIKEKPEIANQPTGFGDQRDASKASAVSKDCKSETDTVSIKPDPDCMTPEQTPEFQRQGVCWNGETEMELPTPSAHSEPDGKQEGRVTIVAQATSDINCLVQSQVQSQAVTGNVWVNVSREDMSQTLACVNRNQKAAPCKICQEVFKQSCLHVHEKKCFKKDFIEHLKQHVKENIENTASNEDQLKNDCSVYGKTSTYASQLTAHLGTCTDKSCYHFKRQTCGEDFEMVDNLKEHILAKHPDEKSNACNTCQASFKSAERLRSHMKTHTKPYVCKDCNTAFATSFRLRCHSRTHTGEKPFACNQCPSTFHTKQLLRVHLKQHTGIKPYICEECGKEFLYRERLIRHRLVHTGERPYVCEFCGAAFRQKANLDTHKLRHRADGSCKRAPKKNFKCSICGSVLSTKRTYDDHMMRHTGERPYKCTYCDAAYVIKFKLKMHMKKHHGATLVHAVSDILSRKKSDTAMEK